MKAPGGLQAVLGLTELGWSVRVEWSRRSDCVQQMVSIGGRDVMVLDMRPNLCAEKLLAKVSSVGLMLRPMYGMYACMLPVS